jgi:hypothetical protein
MERYHDFQIKDHYYWTDEAPAYVTKEEREAKKAAQPGPAKIEPPRYRDWEVIERDGSITYYSAMITDPVVIDGMMV